MELSVYSNNRLREGCALWDVSADMADPMLNYLTHGWEPGSCFTAVLANDFAGAITKSHPSNTVNSFKSLVGWISDYFPREAHGNYATVKEWCARSAEDRRAILEQHRLIYTAKEETWLAIKGEKTQEPVLY